MNPSKVPDQEKRRTHPETSSSNNTPYQTRSQHFSTEEKCYLAYHVNQCFDFENLCQMINLKFGTDHTLKSIQKFLISNCDDFDFFELTEQALAYKWCKTHPRSAVVPPPSMVLGTAEWRTELRAFLAYQASNNMMSAEMERSFNATFPGESRTSEQIANHLSNMNQKEGLVLQLRRFAENYPWHPFYTRAISASQESTKSTKAKAKAAARERSNQAKQKAKDYSNSPGALAVQLELMKKSREAAFADKGESITDPLSTATSRSTTATHFPSSIIQPYNRSKDTVQGPQNRSGQVSGRARSASPSKDQERAKHSVERKGDLDLKVELDLDQDVELDMDQNVEVGLDQNVEVGLDQHVEVGLDQNVELDLDQKVELDLELELELFHDGPNRSVHPKFALCPSNLP